MGLMSNLRDKIEFPFRFALTYLVVIGMVAIATFALNSIGFEGYGFALQLAGFGIAFLQTRRKYRDYLAHLIAQSGKIILNRFILSVVLIAFGTALLAAVMDNYMFSILDQIAFLSFEWAATTRWFALFACYFLFALFLTEATAQKLIREGRFFPTPQDGQTGPRAIEFDDLEDEDALWDTSAASAMRTIQIPQAVAEVLQQLPDDQLDLLMDAAKRPGVPIVTQAGSDNDTLWRLLSNYHLTQAADVPRKIKKKVPPGTPISLTAWTVTEGGGPALSGLRPQGKRLLRVVNA